MGLPKAIAKAGPLLKLGRELMQYRNFASFIKGAKQVGTLALAATGLYDVWTMIAPESFVRRAEDFIDDTINKIQGTHVGELPFVGLLSSSTTYCDMIVQMNNAVHPVFGQMTEWYLEGEESIDGPEIRAMLENDVTERIAPSKKDEAYDALATAFCDMYELLEIDDRTSKELGEAIHTDDVIFSESDFGIVVTRFSRAVFRQVLAAQSDKFKRSLRLAHVRAVVDAQNRLHQLGDGGVTALRTYKFLLEMA